MSDFMKNYKDSMGRYAENILKMTQSVPRIYTSESYLRMIQSVGRLSEGLQGIYSTSNCIKSIQSAQKIADAFKLSMPKVYYNQNIVNGMTKLAESLSMKYWKQRFI